MSSVRFSKGVAALGILTILSIVILLATPAGAWAQGVIGNLEIANSTSESQPGLTDHPDGRMGEVPPAFTDAGEQITTEGETNIEILTGTNPNEEMVVGTDELLNGEEFIEGTLPNGVQNYTSPLVISAADFRSDGGVPNSSMFWFLQGSIEGNANGNGCIMAPVYLPNNAEVYQMWASMVDNEASYTTYVDFRRVDNYTGAMTTLAHVETTVDSPSVVNIGDNTITEPVIQYPDFSYYITTCVSNPLNKILSVRFWFNLP